MINASELLTLAKARRDLANRARRWAAGMTAEADRARLNRYGEELDRLAADLERQAAEQAH